MIPPTTIPESLLVNAYIVPLFWQLILTQSAYPIIPPTTTCLLVETYIALFSSIVIFEIMFALSPWCTTLPIKPTSS